VDDLTFAARRHSSGSSQRAEPPDIEARFKNLVQSPLRAGILRFLSARPDERFDTEVIMQTFGRMRLDVDNCIHELVDFGVVRKHPGDPATYGGVRPDAEPVAKLLEIFLEGRANLGIEDASPSVQRFR